jgi:hypothetical protein
MSGTRERHEIHTSADHERHESNMSGTTSGTTRAESNTSRERQNDRFGAIPKYFFWGKTP